MFLGNTTTPEFGWKGVTDSPLTGLTVNPWDTTKTPGGSSDGATVAAAFGMGVMHVATDGGGAVTPTSRRTTTRATQDSWPTRQPGWRGSRIPAP